MKHFRVSKYNPGFRDKDGYFMRREWTSISDVGREFLSEVLSEQAYLQVENAYVSCLMRFLDMQKVASMVIEEYESGPPATPIHGRVQEMMPANLDNPFDGKILDKIQVGICARLVLRELFWCKLSGKRGEYIHFGYDYNMYVGGSRDIDISDVEVSGVYVEPMVSPYI